MDVKNKYGMTGLQAASEEGHIKVCELLIKNGADVNHEDEDGKSPVKIAKKNGNIELCEKLYKYGAKVDK